MEGGDTLTIRQAAALLGVHPNTVRNRIKKGSLRAEKAITERGQTYMIPRSELGDWTTNRLSSASHSQSPTNVSEGIRAVLEPFVRELGDVREELGRERERREQAERRAEDLKRRLEAAEGRQEPPEGAGPRSDAGGAQEATEGARRPWWRRMFGG